MHVQKVKEQEKAYNKQVRVYHSFIYLSLIITILIRHWLLYWQDKTRQCFIWSLIQSYVYRLYPNNLKS